MQNGNEQGRIHGSISCGGWAGAVRGPVSTTASVTCDWAGAEVQKPLAKQMVTDGPTDRRTDRKHDKISRNQLGRSSNARTAHKMPKDGWTDGWPDGHSDL